MGRLVASKKGEEVGDEGVGQLCAKEMLENLLVGGVAQRHLVEVVGVHELVEDVRTQHDGLGDGDAGVVEGVELRAHFDDVVEEGQAAALATQGALADAGEMRILVVFASVEDGHHAHVLHPAVFHDGIEDDLPVGVHVL